MNENSCRVIRIDCCITYMNPRYLADDWIDEVLELALRHAEYYGAHSCFKKTCSSNTNGTLMFPKGRKGHV